VDAACATVIRVASRVVPRPDVVALMDKQYSAYQKVYGATREIYQTSPARDMKAIV
jgi:hypothetical protein